MKVFTLYLDTHTGRTQVTIEAESFIVKTDIFEFYRGDALAAVFARDKAFGFVEEIPVSDEGPGLGA